MLRTQVLPVIAAPLWLTLWVLLVAMAVVAVLVGIGVTIHLERARADRRSEQVRGELEPVFARFLETEDQVQLADELRPAFLRMDAAHRPVAALLVADLMQTASAGQQAQLRDAFEEAGIVDLGHRGTRRRAPWRRALACEMLGKIGCPRSVPVLLERLDDRRPEVRAAAVRALGDLGSPEAVPALSAAFLERRFAPTNVVGDALRRIGADGAPAFARGLESADPIIRVSSCYGLSAVGDPDELTVPRLCGALGSDVDPRVRAAATAALGILGGTDAPDALLAATADRDGHVRRSAVRALGSFDDPTAVETLSWCTEDDDREVAIRAAEALCDLAGRPRGATAGACLESSSAWSVQYALTVAEVSA